MWKVYRGYNGKYFVGLENSTDAVGPYDTRARADAVAFRKNHPISGSPAAPAIRGTTEDGMTPQEINDRLETGAPCCGQCGEWLKGTENFCPVCGCEQTEEAPSHTLTACELERVRVRISQ